MSNTLHPNLARIAATYDLTIEQLNNRMLTPKQARAIIENLEARDDDGIRWAIDPDTGSWIRKTSFGDAEYDATPPTYGYATATPHDFTEQPSTYNPQDRLTYQAVVEAESHPGALKGATRRLPAAKPVKKRKTKPTPATLTIAALIVTAAALLILL